ncbi:hypothetical protein [Methanogenium cariaci]|uniref:hypothetical protein n=1 Tax=Methanogenium cariaci TaxID=2197 RepID=UPI000781D330|nr:hypothetical protein [Methanogenium cariaci]
MAATSHSHQSPTPEHTDEQTGHPIILFFVCGEGLGGHTSRCLKAAQYCETQGAVCHLAAYGQSHAFLTKAGWPRLRNTPREVTLAGNGGLFCIRKTLWDSKSVPPRDLTRSYRQARTLIADIQPDIVIADTMYAPVEAARRDDVPVLFITNQNRFSTLAGGGENGWAALSRLVSWYLTLPDRVIIPPDFAPPPATVSNYNIAIPPGREEHYRFIGPLIDISRDTYPCTEKTIFASFGGEPFKIPPSTGIWRRSPDAAVTSPLRSLPRCRGCRRRQRTSIPTAMCRIFCPTSAVPRSPSSTAVSPPCTRRSFSGNRW